MSLIWDAYSRFDPVEWRSRHGNWGTTSCRPEQVFPLPFPSSLLPILDLSVERVRLKACLLESVETMLKSGFTNASGASAILRHRNIKHLLLILILFFVSLWFIFRQGTTPAESDRHPQTSVLIHKTAEEIDVLPWPEERWYVGPRNESELEKAALIMLVR